MASSLVDTGCYYDILLLGKTGKGKSTTGNKLLGLTGAGVAPHPRMVQAWKPSAPTQYGRHRTSGADSEPLDLDDDEWPFFRQGDEGDIQSVTKRCKLLSNAQETKVRVLDTPGFADTEMAARLRINLFQANLQSMRWIVRRQQEHELAFSRVLYFLPERGPLEKADRALQEEIKVMVHFFGDSIFYNMVIIATWHLRQSKRGWPFGEEDIQQTQTVFEHVMKSVLTEEGFELTNPTYSQLKCPPVVYISLQDMPAEVLRKVRSARVQGKSMPIIWPGRESSPPQPPPEPQPEPKPEPQPQPELEPVEPSPAIPVDAVPAAAANAPTQLVFRDDVCAKCAVHMMRDENGEEVVKYGDQLESIPYKESKCHPALYPKYTPVQKFFGGVAHIGTGGIPWLLIDMIFKKDSWPGWFNSDEICPKCSGPPGSVGCAPVLQPCEVKFRNNKILIFWIDHTNTLVDQEIKDTV